MGLREYHKKRDFSITPEPRGAVAKAEGRSYCIQKHAATRLHYDFRLELEGVLKSWAVPKGPSYDPADKRLAMQTEDHPTDYGDFEGIIPEGEYGGGTVLLWDRGTWEPIGNPHEGLHKGSLKFALHGEKLQGRWTLVKIKGRDTRDAEKSWLLIKERDELARPASKYSVVDERPESVATGRQMDEIAAARDKVWHSNRSYEGGAAPRRAAAARTTSRRPAAARAAPARKAAAQVDPSSLPGARKAALPKFVPPQLATLVTDPPGGDGWLHEMKFDGYRILCRVEQRGAGLISRNGKDWTGQFPAVAEAAPALGAREALLDGEVAVLLADGTTSFQALQNRMSGGDGGQLVYYVFDLLHLDGYDLTHCPLERRKEALRSLMEGAEAPLRYSDHVVGGGEKFFGEACRLGLEGIISKRRDGTYETTRTRSWLKVKCLKEQEFVIGGFTDPSGTREGLGALLVGVYDDEGRLKYAGKVGTGYTDAVLRDLRRRLRPLEQKTSPFAGRVPEASKAHWVKPELVAEVKFSEWTGDGRLRHPAFKGLREDKPAGEIVRERPKPTERVTGEAKDAGSKRRPYRSGATPPALQSKPGPKTGGETQVAGVRLTHPDRVLYPVQGITKRDLAHYYESIADWILPHLEGRPLTLVRCPEGAEKECFYMKHSGVWAPPALRRVFIKEKTKQGEYLVVDDLAGLIGLVQMGILEIHTWNSTAEKLEQPDRVVFDLDPGPGVAWAQVIASARQVRDRLRELGLTSFVKNSGSKGLHVVVPFSPGTTWEEGYTFASAVAESLARDDPRAYVASMSKAERKGKIFIDYLRNNRGNTSVAAYSTRVHPGAPVSTPLDWDELDPAVGSDHFTVKTLPARLASLRDDPWRAYWKTRQRLTAAVKKRLGI
jgi:bifunctional non-homologous end joining protein LigD